MASILDLERASAVTSGAAACIQRHMFGFVSKQGKLKRDINTNFMEQIAIIEVL
jgi:hypothetical protein